MCFWTGRGRIPLRKVIDDVLVGEFDGLPPHVVEKVDERIQRALEKSAARDSEDYAALPGKLEFCDLRELQDTITSRSLWPQFSERFSNKETLVGKFGQLAELRNGIRHARRVDEVTRKEGEAAILWFEIVLES